MQRIIDILFSVFALLLLSPLFVSLVLLLRFTGEGEIFFLQERIGKNGKTFKVIKFATMIKKSPTIGTGTITLKNDERILPVGKLLRKLKLNELPQIFNVLIGNMSIVGPRPQTKSCFEAFPQSTQQLIVGVRPGISGIGSIVFHDEETILSKIKNPIYFYNNTIAPYKGDLEIWYILNKDIHVYFKIIIVTLWILIFPSSSIVWMVFRDIPIPPKSLRKYLNYHLKKN